MRIQTTTPEIVTFLVGETLYNMQPLGNIDAPLLSTEVVGGFTGAILGLYATGRAMPTFSTSITDNFCKVHISN